MFVYNEINLYSFANINPQSLTKNKVFNNRLNKYYHLCTESSIVGLPSYLCQLMQLFVSVPGLPGHLCLSPLVAVSFL